MSFETADNLFLMNPNAELALLIMLRDSQLLLPTGMDDHLLFLGWLLACHNYKLEMEDFSCVNLINVHFLASDSISYTLGVTSHIHSNTCPGLPRLCDTSHSHFMTHSGVTIIGGISGICDWHVTKIFLCKYTLEIFIQDICFVFVLC